MWLHLKSHAQLQPAVNSGVYQCCQHSIKIGMGIITPELLTGITKVRHGQVTCCVWFTSASGV